MKREEKRKFKQLTFASNSPACVMSLGKPSKITPGELILAVICVSTVFITMFKGTISPALIRSFINSASLLRLEFADSATFLSSFPRLTWAQFTSFAAWEQRDALLLPGPPKIHKTGGQFLFDRSNEGTIGVAGLDDTEIVRVPGRGGVDDFVVATSVMVWVSYEKDIFKWRFKNRKVYTFGWSSVERSSGTVASLPWPKAGGLSWEPKIFSTASLKSL